MQLHEHHCESSNVDEHFTIGHTSKRIALELNATRFSFSMLLQQVHGVAVSIAPVQVQATPIVSIAGPPTQIITTTNCQPIAIADTSQGQQIITTNQTQGQQLIATNTSQGQQLIAANTSQGQQLIAANTSQGQQLIAANTSQAQQIALASSQPAHASQILGTSQITIAPGLPQLFSYFDLLLSYEPFSLFPQQHQWAWPSILHNPWPCRPTPRNR